MVKDPPIQHKRTSEVNSSYTSSKECQIGKIRDHSNDKTSYWKVQRTVRLQKLFRWIETHMPLCSQKSQDLQHRLQRCPATEKLKFDLFDLGGLDFLTKHSGGG